jgi:hypothetical protein
VSFGANPGTSIVVNSTTSILVHSPAGPAGIVDVTVTTPAGTSGTLLADQFTYDARPTVTAVSPTAGPTAGGTPVTITGTGFTHGSTVKFGTNSATGVVVNSATSISVHSPVGAAGTIHVTVTTPGGTSATSAADDFTYDALPTVTAVSPSAGPTSGGTPVTITGTGFTFGSTVQFGTNSATGVVVNSATSISAASPAGAAGTIDVTVTTPGGTSGALLADQFTYIGPSAVPHGYWLVGSDGGIFTFGSALFHGSTGNLRLQRPVVGITPTADEGGYWLVASDGGIFSFGDAGFYGSIPGLGLAPSGSSAPKRLNAPIVAMVPSFDGGGYFMVGADGGVFTFGDATYQGSCPGIGGCAGTAVAVMPDATGKGYWLVTNTGHVYAFGDAPSYGAPSTQSVPVTAAVRTPDGLGYWILLANGVASTYGDANYFGSPSGITGGLNPATAIFATADGRGYWVTTGNGTVYNYGDASADGGITFKLNGSIIAGTGF